MGARTVSISWSDPAPLAEAGRSMSGLDFLRAIRDGRLAPAPISELLGFSLVEVEPGRAVFEVVPGERHFDPIGVVHGGLAMTLLDSAMACSVQTQIPAGAGYTTLEVKVNLVRPITAATGRLRSARHCMPAAASPRPRAGSRTARASSSPTARRPASS